jgi:hypothetical protein
MTDGMMIGCWSIQRGFWVIQGNSLMVDGLMLGLVDLEKCFDQER